MDEIKHPDALNAAHNGDPSNETPRQEAAAVLALAGIAAPAPLDASSASRAK